MNKREKIQILTNINTFDIDVLTDFISANQITLSEMISAGLSEEKQAELKQFEERIQQQKSDKNRVLALCKDIEDSVFDAKAIKRMLLNNELTEADLLANTSLDQSLIKRIRNFEQTKLNFNLWDDLPPLEDKRTDVYFFGQPGSGKSCVLASLFYFLEKNGLMQVDLTNLAGATYRAQLKDDFEYGILPESTTVDGVNYIALDIRNKEDRNKWHPLNFIEMSGEHFNSAFEQGISADNLNQKNYLLNENRKLIFFVIDYDAHVQGREAGQRFSQASMMVNVLELLDDQGILKKTDAVYILLTKSDLFPDGVDRKKFAMEFLNEHYRNFLENCKDQKFKHNESFKLVVFPYSIGQVKFNDILMAIDDTSPKYITEAIRSFSFYKKTKTGLFN
ncbi:MAG: hypothetical protein C0592_00500 [Marinilabiliales bacterium]|nr:MAG: hypothetical protein C0592_00500 [Marinilabiliales bacterium]